MANSRKRANLIEHVVAFLNRHSVSGKHLALGLSGGLDSCVLLHLLAKAREQFDFQFSAIHVNHQISPNAGEWADFCAALCADESVRFSAVRVDVPRDSGLGSEAAAREVRYRALREHGADVIALAHHQDDQAETFLLQMLRGAGVKGLSAMPAASRQNVIRPLLDVPRSQLLQYAELHGLQWIEDESNANLRYDRNFLRQQILPEIAARFPAYRVTFARTAEHLANAAELLDQIALEDAKLAVTGRQLDISYLRVLTAERAGNLMRWWISQETGQIISTARLQNMLQQLLDAKTNARVECVIGEAVLRRYREMAYLDFGAVAVPYLVEWRGEERLSLPDNSLLLFKQVVGEGMIADRVKDGLVVTNRLGAGANWKMSLRLDCKRPMRTLKNLWQEMGIPPWERDGQPLLWQNGSLIALSGRNVDCNWLAEQGQRGVVAVWCV